MTHEEAKAWEDSPDWAAQKKRCGQICERCGERFGPELFQHMPWVVRNVGTGEVLTVCGGQLNPV